MFTLSRADVRVAGCCEGDASIPRPYPCFPRLITSISIGLNKDLTARVFPLRPCRVMLTYIFPTDGFLRLCKHGLILSSPSKSGSGGEDHNQAVVE